MTGDQTARTDAVTGTITIAGDEVTGAAFTIDLAAIQAAGRTPPQLVISLDTDRHPAASAAITHPVPLPPAFHTGSPATITVPGVLELRGVTHEVPINLTARRDGATLQVAGSLSVAFADWGIEGPEGYGALASVADHAEGEFLLVLQRP